LGFQDNFEGDQLYFMNKIKPIQAIVRPSDNTLSESMTILRSAFDMNGFLDGIVLRSIMNCPAI